ncbi:hypothetical protein MANES_04G102700v8 [Manihot esculenta]|uniref:EF-hand domain-containing protein n=1 Tax=Manihot esculenta TaxID=3983 RepID=A0A2C9W1A3_MANES|nr:hypothetical protein MANES_04G102700v8 [Manihot esculenta]
MYYDRCYTQDYNVVPYPSPYNQPMYEEKPPIYYDRSQSFWGPPPPPPPPPQGVWFANNPPPPPPPAPRQYHMAVNPFRVNKYKDAPVPFTEEQVRQVFMKFDLNGDNVLSREEIRQAFNYLGAMFPAYRARQGIKFSDANGDGVIDMSEIDDLVKYAYNLGFNVR